MNILEPKAGDKFTVTEIRGLSTVTDERLRRSLLTLDGQGKQFKEACLNELLNRAIERGGKIEEGK